MKDRIKQIFRAPVATSAAILFGGLMLATYIFPLEGIRQTLLDWVVIAAAAALLVGVFNLVIVHLTKVRLSDGNPIYSSSLILALLLTFIVTLLDKPGGFDPQWLVTYIQIPVETSLLAVLAVTLTYAGIRLVSRRLNAYTMIFGASLLVTLISFSPMFGFNFTLVKVSASAGGRGILLGVALGTVTTGLRILLGSDRPYGG